MSKTFKKYQHIVRINDPEVEGILNGKVYLFTKLDGTNSSIWKDDDRLHFASRRREVSLEDDNAGFMNRFIEDQRIVNFFNKYPNVRLFGEYLVPHQVKSYKEDAWREFYVFDVVEDIEEVEEGSRVEHFRYMRYEDYVPMLEEFNISFIPAITTLNNPDVATVESYIDTCTFLNGNVSGEGIVIKNYDYCNCYGRRTWAKIVRSDYKQAKSRIRSRKSNEKYDEVVDQIVNRYVTEAFIQKEYYKLVEVFNNQNMNPDDQANRNKFIGMLLNQVYRSVLEEEIYNITKKLHNPTINFNALQKEVNNKIKVVLPEVF